MKIYANIARKRRTFLQTKCCPKASLNFTAGLETDRFGPFTFQPGFVAADVRLALQRVEDAHERFVASLSPRWLTV